MFNINKIYEKNKELDELFNKKYNLYSEEIIAKNKIELMVEFNELLNESKCFKYWSTKDPNYEKLVYEYADGLMMILTFFNVYRENITINDNLINKESDIIKHIFYLYNLYNDFINNDANNLNVILNNYLYFGELLKIDFINLEEVILDKINKTKEGL